MKSTPTFLLSLLFSTLMFSSPSYGEWTKAAKNISDRNFYVDLERIRKVDGYVYWWDMIDFSKPQVLGMMSGKKYNQGDCKLFQYKVLSFSFHKERMGLGTGERSKPTSKFKDWRYPAPNSVDEKILEKVCNHGIGKPLPPPLLYNLHIPKI